MPSFAKHSPCFALPCVSTANQFLSRSKNMVSRIKIVCCALGIRSALENISTAIETSSFAKQTHSSAKTQPFFRASIFLYRETISSALASALLSLMAFHIKVPAQVSTHLHWHHMCRHVSAPRRVGTCRHLPRCRHLFRR